MNELRTLPVHVPGAPHDYVLGRGLLGDLGRLVAEVREPSRVAVVTDETVGALYLGTAAESLESSGFDVLSIVVPPGEGTKSLQECERVWRLLGEGGVERGGLVVALGGGVVGDLAGFCAATWKRGVPVVQVPTTVLAMADASIGGKTGVNLDLGKNLVGAFHQPTRIVADVATLVTLEPRDLRSGLAEVVKCALLDDRARLDRLRVDAGRLRAADARAFRDAILPAAETKIRIVEGDPHETGGQRVLLNLGHTVGHALETERGHGELRHGEAVAIGLVVEARVAVALGLAHDALADEIRDTLRELGLPTELPVGCDPETLVELTRHDKKRAAGERLMVLPLDGAGAGVESVDDDTLREALG